MILLYWMASAMRRNPTAATGGRDAVLPLDVVFDILVRLPARDICRLRAVCRQWRSLTSDPVFIEAHTASHPATPPLIVASFHGDGDQYVHIMDLDSGRVVKRLPLANHRQGLVPSRLDLVCVADYDGRNCSVIDPATGAVIARLPETPPEEEEDWSDEPLTTDDWQYWHIYGPVYSWFVLGRVDGSRTGECRVLRLSSEESSWEDDSYQDDMISSVIAVDEDAGCAPWRWTGSPAFLLDMHSGVVVGNSVYFFWCTDEYPDEDQKKKIRRGGIVPDCIACFDLETEEWSTLSGPCPVDSEEEEEDHDDSDDDDDDDDDDSDDDDDDGSGDYYHSDDDNWCISMLSDSTLSELKGYLVMAHNFGSRCVLDLWFLMDTESSLWIREYRVDTTESIKSDLRIARPLLVLDDGRIVIFCRHKGVLVLYDPKGTTAYSELETRRLDEVGLYTGSVLSLQSVSQIK